MQLSNIFTSALLAAGAVADPPEGGPGWKNCLSHSQVTTLIDGYTYLLVHPGGPQFNSTANAILTPDFQAFSDSILYLSGRPLNGTPAYPSRNAWIASQHQTPPLPVLDTLSHFYDCAEQKIGWRWKASGIGSKTHNISGMIDIDLDGSLIKTVYSEFNTAAFLFDLGTTACVFKQ